MPVSQKENSINFQTESGNSRRTFIKKTVRLTLGLGLVGGIADQVLVSSEKSDTGKPFTVSILQTTDVHCQVHAHDELFWENGQPVFRKTGGYAHLSAYFKQQRQINPHTFAIDTTAITTKAPVPICANKGPGHAPVSAHPIPNNKPP